MVTTKSKACCGERCKFRSKTRITDEHKGHRRPFAIINRASQIIRQATHLSTFKPLAVETACSWAWKRPHFGAFEHINALELHAALTAVKWRVLKARNRRKRFLHLVDSLVSLHVVNKGRSSSRKLRAIMKQISAWLLMSGNSCVLGYVDTGQNPADAPSRRGQKRKWSNA